jgi:hypothetical protein
MKSNMNIQRKNIKVKDAYTDLNIRILPSDLKDAICKDHQNCVIAKAIKRKLKAQWVDVGANTVLVAKGPRVAYRYKLNSLAKDQVRYFDKGKGFVPCKIHILAPPESQRLTYRAGTNARSGKSGRKATHRSKPTR